MRPWPTAAGLPDMAPRLGDPRDEVRGWATARRHAPRARPRGRAATTTARTPIRELAPQIAEALTRPRGAADDARGHPRPRRLSPRPDPDRPRWLPDHRLRGRAAGQPGGTARPPSSAARRRLDAALARSRRPAVLVAAPIDRSRRTVRARRASTSTRGCAGHASGSSTRIATASVEARVVPATDPDLLRAFEVDKELYEYRLRGHLPALVAVGTRPRACAACSTTPRDVTSDLPRTLRVALFEADCRRLAGGADSPAERSRPRRISAAGRRFAMTGLGSSRYAAAIVAAALRAPGGSRLGRVASADGAAPRRRTTWSVLAISASGRTPEVIEAAARHRGSTLVVAVTNDAGLTGRGRGRHTSCRCYAGEERSGIASRIVPGHGRGARRSRPACADRGRLRAESPDAIARRLGRRRPRSRRSTPGRGLLDGPPAIDVLAPAPTSGSPSRRRSCSARAPRLPAHAHGDRRLAAHGRLPRPARSPRRARSPAPPPTTRSWPPVERRGGERGDGRPRAGRGSIGSRRPHLVASVIGRAAGGRAVAPDHRRASGLLAPSVLEGRPDLADPLDRLEVERVAEHEDDLVDAEPPVARPRARRPRPAARRPSGRVARRRSRRGPRGRGAGRSPPRPPCAASDVVADDGVRSSRSARSRRTAARPPRSARAAPRSTSAIRSGAP